ncbi:MAG: N-formylglutamate amidohydrolase [Chitinispirillaceae bacterium]|nr:N-formylglutamate amidohydrolase [Chitinispirillaceae bacterium]
MSPATLILTCEHAGNSVPARYRRLFMDHRPVLRTHEAYDRGALSIARFLAKTLAAPLFFSNVTRLLIDQNRSVTNRNLFSRFSRGLPSTVKDGLIDGLYQTHRARIAGALQRRLTARGKVLHIAIHTFIPVLRGKARNGDLGLLYDPSSPMERRMVSSLRKELRRRLPDLRIRVNYPYRGTSDGLTVFLRRMFGKQRYAGIEIEINQKWSDPLHPCGIRRGLAQAIRSAVYFR